MQALARPCPSLSGRLAENLLKAWLIGDESRIHTELDRSISLSFETHDQGEQERRRLLHAVASRMQTYPDLLSSPGQSPKLSLYMNLLWHLVPLQTDAGALVQ